MPENKKEKIFADGFRFEKPREGSPDFVKGRISVKVPEAVAFLQQHQNNGGWVNLEIKKSKEGKFYIELDTYEAKPKVEVKEENLPF